MARKKKHEEHESHERWLVSYADFITLLFAFFVVMFATSQVDSQKVGRFVESVNTALDIKGSFPNTGSEPIVEEGSHVTSPPVVAALIANLQPKKGDVSQGRVERNSMQPLRAALTQYLARPDVKSRVRTVRDRRGLTLSMAGTSLFAPGGEDLVPGGRVVLERFAELLRNFNVQVMVEGHTDSDKISTDRYPTNWDLSTARATSVIRFLSEVGGVPPYRFVAVGYGGFRPIAPNDSSEGRAQNRRVDFVLLGIDPLIMRENVDDRSSPEDGIGEPPHPSAHGIDAVLSAIPEPAAAPPPAPVSEPSDARALQPGH